MATVMRHNREHWNLVMMIFLNSTFGRAGHQTHRSGDGDGAGPVGSAVSMIEKHPRGLAFVAQAPIRQIGMLPQL